MSFEDLLEENLNNEISRAANQAIFGSLDRDELA